LAQEICKKSVLRDCEHTEASVIASKKIGLEVNAEKTGYKIMSRDQNAGHHNTKVGKKKILLKSDTFRIFGNNPNKIKIPFMKKLTAD
jgi:hypothetical protein